MVSTNEVTNSEPVPSYSSSLTTIMTINDHDNSDTRRVLYCLFSKSLLKFPCKKNHSTTPLSHPNTSITNIKKRQVETIHVHGVSVPLKLSEDQMKSLSDLRNEKHVDRG